MGRHNVKVFLIPPVNRDEVYVTVPDWWLMYESSHFLYVQAPPGFAYCSRLYLAGGNNCDLAIAIAKTESLVIYLASFFATRKYEHVEHF